MEWDVSIWASARERSPLARRPDWCRLQRTLTRPIVVGDVAKAELPAWSPTTYREGSTRGLRGVSHVTCLVLDYDDGTTIGEAVETWKPWPGILHTSISHGADVPRFRVILPLLEPVPTHQWPAVWAWAFRHSGGTIDPKCKDASRIYFLPSIRAEDSPWEAQAWTPWVDYLGEHIPWADELAALEAPPPVTPRPPLAVKARHRDRALAALLRSDPYARLELARQLGAATDGETLARRVECPQCGRRDVWFPIHPARRASAQCNHISSCGWFGDLFTLYTAHGGAT